jgi:hypothetical protein
VIVNVPREAFYVWACHDCTVAHNSYYAAAPNSSFRVLPSDFTDATGALIRINHSTNLVVVDNLFFSGAGFNDMVVGPATEATGLVISHNLWYGKSLGTSATVYSDLPFAGDATSLYASDPLLTPPPDDMKPSAVSPVIGKGMALPFAPDNFDGVPWHGAPNIGAY